ncbi:hypothetical protein [Alteribacter natronophilus]|uniref:hypothetical protein n=1 Tax=Alteribacter natronophilus TaxID=2583810 RepID=UPI00110D606B|nr:hypothetical protein [Alteribacter natronophilus]TMW72858.1 hypothetical protein FGB90_00655 [Alteribacter natronophilus]
MKNKWYKAAIAVLSAACLYLLFDSIDAQRTSDQKYNTYIIDLYGALQQAEYDVSVLLEEPDDEEDLTRQVNRLASSLKVLDTYAVRNPPYFDEIGSWQWAEFGRLAELISEGTEEMPPFFEGRGLSEPERKVLEIFHEDYMLRIMDLMTVKDEDGSLIELPALTPDEFNRMQDAVEWKKDAGYPGPDRWLQRLQDN